MTGWEHENPENFLRILENTSNARLFCRSAITNDGIESVLEVGCGGLNERRALAEAGYKGVYVGTDITWKFVENGIKHYPEDDWVHVDVNNLLTKVYGRYDIVYSQHVLEHCSGIGTPLSNMLKAARRYVLNIFFVNPTGGPFDKIDWTHYPVYTNTYSKRHIERICNHHGFDAEFKQFRNDEFMGTPRVDGDVPIPPIETVLIATRRNQ